MQVLLVDDVQLNRKILEAQLKRKGYEVVQAASGMEAIELVKGNMFDVVLMDINMPGMDGIEATRQLKTIRPENYLPIIFVTSESEEEALEKGLTAGGDDFVTKPVNFSILASKIEAHSRIRELYKEINRKNIELAVHNSRLRREHSLVSHFFNQAKKYCFFDERYIKTFSSSMTMFNGDTVLSAIKPNGGINVLLGDFTGHGLSAAVGTLPVAQIFFQMSEENAYIGDIARELNRQINFLLPTEMFLAVSLAELSAAGDRLMVWHGGMPDAYLLDTKSNKLTTIKSQHLPVGVREPAEFNDAVQLYYVNENIKFIVFTDGISEVLNKEEKMIDVELIKQAIINNSVDTVAGMVDCYRQYSKGMPQSDDISLLELSCLPSDKERKHHLNPVAETVPWEMSLTIEGDKLKRDCVDNIINLIGNSQIINEHKASVFTILTEMYSNALDHGLLELHGDAKVDGEAFDDFYRKREERLERLTNAFINIKICYKPDGDNADLMIIVSHNGSGFDESRIKAKKDDLYGRGLMLIEAMSKSFSFSDNGRCLEVVYQL